MSERDREMGEPEAAALRRGHAARAESAAARAAALSHYIKRGAEEQSEGSTAHTNAAWKAAHAARMAAQALDVLSGGVPDPAADSRCARNAAASAAQASQMGQLVDSDAEASITACKAAVQASLAASAAAGAGRLGTDEELNSQADAAEKAAVEAGERAGWIQPGADVPAVASGVRSSEVHAMLHF